MTCFEELDADLSRKWSSCLEPELASTLIDYALEGVGGDQDFEALISGSGPRRRSGSDETA
jgi:hypothetical protein